MCRGEHDSSYSSSVQTKIVQTKIEQARSYGSHTPRRVGGVSREKGSEVKPIRERRHLNASKTQERRENVKQLKRAGDKGAPPQCSKATKAQRHTCLACTG